MDIDMDMDASDADGESPGSGGGDADNSGVGDALIADESPDDSRAEKKKKKKEKKPKVKKAKAPRQGPLVPDSVGTLAAALGGILFLGGLIFFLWAGHIIPLNGVFMPLIEENTDIRPPHSSLGRDRPDTARLLKKAEDVAETNPVEAAVLLKRVLNQGANEKATERADYVNATIGVRAE
jgi:hypothetical protein